VKKTPEELRREILRLTSEYSEAVHRAMPAGATDFLPGQTTIPYAGRVFDAEEVQAAVGSSLDFWLTLGPEGEAFEQELAGFLGAKRCLLANSGSSANLLAVSSLTSHKLPEERRLNPGDEVITVAAGFPTTVAPIIQNRAVPVFIDSDPLTLNARCEQLDEAFRPGKTKAVMMAHTLGNPFDLHAVTAFCQRHNLWLIEDNCDALGSEYTLPSSAPALTGTFGDMSSQSFYPAHHMTLGEGGAVNISRDMKWKVLIESFRDWGRDCWCASGKDNTCGKRFGWQLGELPEGYDHKYIYSHLGYNLKPLDLQAAIGRAQLKKLPAFIEARRANWDYLRSALADLTEFFDFQLPTHATKWRKPELGNVNPEGNISAPSFQPSAFSLDASGASCRPSWFGFMLLVKPEAPFNRTELSRELERCKIGNRTLFGGNLVRQPAWTRLRRDNPSAFRVIGDLAGADEIMNRALFIGVYPGLSRPMMDYMAVTIRDFVRGH
jgi:CDP-6-deoxy-D-xylo-4-hexulose-3-dehydrase